MRPTTKKQFTVCLTIGATSLLFLVLYMTSGSEVKTAEVKEERWKVNQYVLNAKKRAWKDYNQDLKLELLRDNSITSNLTGHDLAYWSDLQVELTIHSVLDNPEILCHRKLRMGNLGDGGWEICDDPEVRPREKCVVYSFGINNDFSFDDHVAKIYGCHVYAFDPSMDVPSHNRSSLVHFYRLGISDHDHVDTNGWQLKTLDQLRAMLGHQNTMIDVIKMDVEFAEWLALPEMIKSGVLKHVRQFLVEFHVHLASSEYYRQVMPGDKTSDAEMNRRRLGILRDFNLAGFRLFYPHKNVHCTLEVRGFPSDRTECYEVHYMKPDWQNGL